MIPHEKMKDNDFLCQWNMENATREQKISWLCQIIENEFEKPEQEQDADLIAECSDCLCALSDGNFDYSEEDLQAGLAEIKRANEPVTAVLPQKKTKRRLLGVAVGFAAIITVFFALTITAKNYGYSNAWDFVSQNVERILNLNPGESIEEGDITFIKGEDSVIYSSIEELIQKENYNILYPSKLPDNVQINRIIQQPMNDNSLMLSWHFNDPNLFFSISTKASVSEEDMEHFEKHTLSNITFYIDTKPDNVYQAIGYANGYEYQIIYNNYDLLITILDNLKGIES